MKELFTKYFKMIKKGDVVIVLALMILSFLPIVVFAYNQSQYQNAKLIATISHDGEEVAVFGLIDDVTEEYVFYDEAHEHYNRIVREGDRVYIDEANCTDQLCVRMGEISQVGETIVCLPNRIIVEITASEEASNMPPEVDIVS